MSFFLEHLPSEIILNIFEKYFENDSKLFDLNNVSSMVYFSLRTKQIFEKHLASKNARNFLKHVTSTKNQFTIANEIKFDNWIIHKFYRSNFIIDQNIYFFAHIEKVEQNNGVRLNQCTEKNILCLFKIDMYNLKFEKEQVNGENILKNFKNLTSISNVISTTKESDIKIVVGHVTIYNRFHFVNPINKWFTAYKFVYNSTVYMVQITRGEDEQYIGAVQINDDVYIVTQLHLKPQIKVYKISKNSSNNIFFTNFNFTESSILLYHIKTSFVSKNSDELYICMIFESFVSVLVLDLKTATLVPIYQCVELNDANLRNGIFFIESKILNGVYLATTEIISKVKKEWTENLSLTFIELRRKNAHISHNFYSIKLVFDSTINDYCYIIDYNIKNKILEGVNVKAAFNKEYILIVCFDRILFLQLDIESNIFNNKTKQLISSFLKYRDFGNFSNTFIDSICTTNS